MDTRTGEIVDWNTLNRLPPDERRHYARLTRKQAKELLKLPPQDRVKWSEGMRGPGRRAIPLTPSEERALRIDTPEERQLVIDNLPFAIYLERLMRHDAQEGA